MSNNKFYYFLFCLIILVGFLIRAWDIDKNPPGFFCDEASMGYNAYKIMTTGKDEFGVILPVLSKTLGDYRLTLPMYLNIPAIFLFGLNEFSIRTTSIIIGTLGIVFLMLLTYEIINKKTALLAGLLLAVNPWQIHFSRWGIECIYFPTFLTISLYLFVKSLRDNKLLILAFIFFGLTMYTYYAALIIVPIILISVILIWLIKKRKQGTFILLLGLLIYLLFTIPLCLNFANGYLLTRWNSMNRARIDNNTRLLAFKNNYLKNISYNFLFKQGDRSANYRHYIKETGELYIFQLPLLIVGLIFILFRRKIVNYMIFLLLLIFPLTNAVIANEGPTTTRSLIGVVPLTFFSSVGLYVVLEIIQQIKFKTVFILLNLLLIGIIGTSVIYYLYNLYVVYPTYSAGYWGWQYGYRQSMEYFKTQENNYDELLITHLFNGNEALLNFYNVNLKYTKCKGMSNPISVDQTKKQLFSIRSSDIDDAKRIYPNLKFNIINKIYLPNRQPELYIGYFY